MAELAVEEHFSGEHVRKFDNFEAFYPGRYRQTYPDGGSPGVESTGRISILDLAHGTHFAKASEIEPQGDHPDEYVFKFASKVGKKFDGVEWTFKYVESQDKFELVHNDDLVLPGKYSWWGVSVERWYYSDDPNGQAFGRRVKELKEERIFVAEYLQTSPPECHYGNIVFTISLKDLLNCYSRSRADVTDAEKRTIKLRFAGTLRYRYEICYVVVISMKNDDDTLSEFHTVNEDRSVFDHNGLVNEQGEIVDISATPFLQLKHVIKCVPTRQYRSWETLAFAFYCPTDSNNEQLLLCEKSMVTKLEEPNIRHKCDKHCKK